jgi:hypothetical protein
MLMLFICFPPSVLKKKKKKKPDDSLLSTFWRRPDHAREPPLGGSMWTATRQRSRRMQKDARVRVLGRQRFDLASPPPFLCLTPFGRCIVRLLMNE